MKERKNWLKIVGLVVHCLIAALMIVTGLQKVLGSVPPAALVTYRLGDEARVIGAGAIVTALLLVIPRTSSFGILLTSSFWGGAICIHMAHGEPYLLQVAMLLLSWAGAYLRKPAAPSTLVGRLGMTEAGVAASELVVW
jgi:hypothetical protein